MNSFAFIFGCFLVTYGLVKVADAIRWLALGKITVVHKIPTVRAEWEPVRNRPGWGLTLR